MPRTVKVATTRKTKTATIRPGSASSKKAQRSTSVNANEVARVAYGLWEARGCTHGGAQNDWIEAERIVSARQ